MTGDVTEPLEEVLRKMNAMVASDGCEMTVRSYEPAGVLEVDYLMRLNEDCPTCGFSGAMMKTFLEDSLESHGVPVAEVRLIETVASSS